MALFLARAGTASRIHRAFRCLQAPKVVKQTDHKAFLLTTGQLSSFRSFVTAGETRLPFAWRFRTQGCNGVVNKVFDSNLRMMESARCFSSGITTASGDLVSEVESSNPFLKDSVPESLLDAMAHVANNEQLQDMADTVASAAEPTISSLGLGGYSPVGLIQHVVEFLHVSGGLSWCASIALTTLVIRLCFFPLMIKAQANTARLNNIKPQQEEIQAQIRELSNSHDQVANGMASMKLKQLYKDNNCHPFKSLIGPLVQLPIFISFFFAIRRMANLPVESMKTGGYLWFQDLTMFDPYFVLPIVCTFSMLASLELGGEAGVSSAATKTTKNIFRVITIGTTPFVAQFPTALLSYWITSNVLTLGQVALLKIPAVRKGLGIPELIKHPTTESSGSFWENMKAAYKTSEETTKLKYMEKMKRQRQQALGEAPLQQTYEFNPRIKHNQKIFNLKGKKSKKTQLNDRPGTFI